MVWLKKMFNRLLDILKWPYVKWNERKLLKKKLKELKERDPFIYK